MGDIMIGKLLKVSKNDLSGNVDDRIAAVYAAFKHNKYMNRYVIFSYVGEYANNKLYVGSVHLKENSLVVFEVRPEELEYINKFVTDLLSNTLNPSEYEVLDISKMEKVEIVSVTEEEFNGLNQLDAMTIKREAVVVQTEEPKKKKPVGLYILLVFFILLLIGITYLYLNPDILKVELKSLDCTMSGYDRKIMASYNDNAIAKFDRNNELISLDREEVYKFKDEETYNEFKDNKREEEYFKDLDFEYNDSSLELKIIHDERLIIISYEEVYKYLKSKGYSCIEGIYNEE